MQKLYSIFEQISKIHQVWGEIEIFFPPRWTMQNKVSGCPVGVLEFFFKGKPEE